MSKLGSVFHGKGNLIQNQKFINITTSGLLTLDVYAFSINLSPYSSAVIIRCITQGCYECIIHLVPNAQNYSAKLIVTA